MKNLILLFSLLHGMVCFAQTADPIIVTNQSINIAGSITVGAWKSQHSNEEYPDYPKLYYGFAEGDEILIDFSTENKKGNQIIEISEFESNSVVYSNKQFQTLEGVKVKVPKTAVYKFEFATNHVFDRQCKVVIKRIPASEAGKNFNCNVTWKIVNDTTFTVTEERRKVSSSYEAITLQSPIDYYINSGSNAFWLGGKSRITFPVILPENTVEWYYTFAATRNKDEVQATKSRMKLFSDLAQLVTGMKVLSFGINAITQPPGADYCDVYLLNPQHFQAFQNKEDDKWGYIPEGTRENLKSGVVKVRNCCTTNTYYMGLKNPDGSHGVSVMIEIVAVVEKAIYETIQVKRPISTKLKKVPVFGEGYVSGL
jgi:hypothetical protein